MAITAVAAITGVATTVARATRDVAVTIIVVAVPVAMLLADAVPA